MSDVKLSTAQAETLRRIASNKADRNRKQRVLNALQKSLYIYCDGTGYHLTDAGRAALDRVFGVKP